MNIKKRKNFTPKKKTRNRKILFQKGRQFPDEFVSFIPDSLFKLGQI